MTAHINKEGTRQYLRDRMADRVGSFRHPQVAKSLMDRLERDHLKNCDKAIAAAETVGKTIR